MSFFLAVLLGDGYLWFTYYYTGEDTLLRPLEVIFTHIFLT